LHEFSIGDEALASYKGLIVFIKELNKINVSDSKCSTVNRFAIISSKFSISLIDLSNSECKIKLSGKLVIELEFLNVVF
jgi:hypothetical protein